MATREIKDLFKKSSEYDSKHINNLSTKKVPQALLDAVEEGCSYETLQQLAGKQFPICRYQTQITVHGIFSEPKTNRVGGYVNLTHNKNKSLGIRWTAIDHDKKEDLFDLICTADKEWRVLENSQEFSLYKQKRVSKEEYREKLEQYKQKAESINTGLFTGWASAYGTVDLWGQLFVVLVLNVQCFPVENMQAIAQNVTEQDMAAIVAAREAEQERRRLEEERWEAERKAAKEAREKAAKERQERINAWVEKNPVPAQFKLTENHTFQPGDIEAYGVTEQGEGFAYRYRIYSKAFGRLIFTECDINGKKMGKGTEALLKTRAKAYVKCA